MNDKIKEIEIEKIFTQGGVDLRLLDFDNNKSLEDLLIYDRILSHEFAKKYFGEELFPDPDILYCLGDPDPLPAWQYHLQQMVLLDADEQLKYLSEFLN